MMSASFSIEQNKKPSLSVDAEGEGNTFLSNTANTQQHSITFHKMRILINIAV
jgi:hypothetical protein